MVRALMTSRAGRLPRWMKLSLRIPGLIFVILENAVIVLMIQLDREWFIGFRGILIPITFVMPIILLNYAHYSLFYQLKYSGDWIRK